MMKGLLDSVCDLAALLPPERLIAIAHAVKGVAPPDGEKALRQLVATPSAKSSLMILCREWKESSVSDETLAGMLLGACHARHRTLNETRVDLVWTGPTTPFVAVRRTEQVLLDLIRAAHTQIFLVSFVAYDVPTIAAELNLAAERGVDIDILLEASSTDGGSLQVDPIATMRSSVPAARLYTWLDKQGTFLGGKVHAKVAVADSTLAFLSSANLTGHAMERNIEAGVLIKGGELPASLNKHLNALITTGVIIRRS